MEQRGVLEAGPEEEGAEPSYFGMTGRDEVQQEVRGGKK